MKSEAKAFSLVELMAVVGIMALLAVVAAPALRGLAGTGGRKQAVGQIMGALELARNTALATGTNAAVVIPDSTFTRTNYSYRSLAVVAWNPTNPAADPAMVGGWISLPEGVAIFPNSLTPLAKTNVNLVLPPNQTVLSVQPMIIFQPDGGLYPKNDGTFPTNGLAIFEGTVAGGTADRQGRTNRVETIILSPYTGRARGTLRVAP
jgi:prepilin-type N-terminal cleavage/methylation domain-containing protein